MVRARGLRKAFDGCEVLRGIDLDVAGEVLAIVGPSGSRKSTLLRCLNALELPSAGDVEIDGEPLLPAEAGVSDRARQRHLSRMRARVGMVFQRFNLFPHRARQRHRGLLVVRCLPEREARDRAAAMLDRVGLGPRADAYPAQLSGGQQQRVAIARALVMEPRVMLFDEATSALDPELKGEMLDVMRVLAEGRLTMLVVTHEMGSARDVARRVLFLDEGRIVEEGDARAFFAAPREERARAFLRRVSLS